MSSEFVAVLPNLRVENPINCHPISITSSRDERVEASARRYPGVGDFLSRFFDAHGENISPGVVLWEATPGRTLPSFEALCSFRDLVAMSHILVGRARAVGYGNPFAPQWADCFWIYPWTLNNDYSCIVCRTPAVHGVHELESFRGQASPEVPRSTLSCGHLDTPLFNALSRRWRAVYLNGSNSHADVALFRSLNMAYRAGAIPGGFDDTNYDYGRSIALWVSAFEILAHPGPGKKVDHHVVYELLEKASFISGSLSSSSHMTYEGRRSPRSKRTLACWLYGEIYHARNDFLHGNPIPPDRLFIANSRRHLLNFAPALYRVVLSTALGVDWSTPTPSSDSPDELGNSIAERIAFRAPQMTIEAALLKCLDPA